ncbi:hypothetical protein GCM10027614_74310 [Micromonospora vulcania]
MAFTDGIRRTMSSDERARIATKAGWFADARHEAGVIFDRSGAAVLTYALFADGQANPDDFGATHPAVQARAAMGPVSWPRWTGSPVPGRRTGRLPAARATAAEHGRRTGFPTRASARWGRRGSPGRGRAEVATV